MACEISHSVLHGYLDGELDASRSAEFERHLEGCAECRSTLDQQEALHNTLKRAELREAAPLAVRAKVRGALPKPASQAVTPRRQGLKWIAIAAGFVIAFFISWRAFTPRDPYLTASVGVEQILDAHLRSLQPGHLADVISTDQHTVKPWFDGRISFAPPVTDFTADGFPLEGGRLDILNGQTVAALVYGRRKHIINVFVWPSDERNLARREGSNRGYNWIHWRRNGMEYCAISDVSSGDLKQLADLVSR